MDIESLAARMTVIEMAISRLSQQITKARVVSEPRTSHRDIGDRVVKLLSGSKGMTFGVICNRFRNVLRGDVQQALDALLLAGKVSNKTVINRYNKTTATLWWLNQ